MTQITAEQAQLEKTVAETSKLEEETRKLNAEASKLWAEANKQAAEYALTNKKAKWYEVTMLIAIIAATVAATKAFL